MFFLISQKYNAQKPEDKGEESEESGPMWSDWRTT